MAHHSANFAFRKGFDIRFWGSGLLALAGMQRGRLFLWCPVVFACGVALYFSLSSETDIRVGGSLFILSCSLALWGLRGVFDGSARTRRLVLFMVPVLFFAGFGAAQLRSALVDTSFIAKKTRSIDIVGTVVGIDYLPKGKAARLTLSDLVLEDISEPPRLIRVRVHERGEVSVGARVRMRGVLNPPPEPVLPGGYDFARALYFKGIGAVGYAFYPPEILSVEDPSVAEVYLERLRMYITNRIFAALPEREASVAAALITGHKTGISESDREAMRASGLAHLLAISGLHIGLVCGLIFFVVRFGMACFERFALEHPVKKYAALIALFGTCFYMLIAGSTIPTQRALLMTGVVLMAVLFDRMAISLRLVAFAALVVLAIAPESLLSVSFQLSFAAVTGLVAFYEWARVYLTRMHGHGGWLRRVGLYVGGVAVTSVVASLSTMPFVLYHFQQIAAYGVIGNILAVPLMAFWVMPCGLLALLLMPLGLDGFALSLMGQGISLILDVALWVQSLEGSVFTFHALPFGGFVAFVVGGLLLCCLAGGARLVGLLPMVVAVILCWRAPMADILIDRSLDLVAVREADTGAYVVNSKRGQSFARGRWEAALGLQKHGFLQWGEVDQDGFGCDETACRAVVKGRKVSYVRDFYGQATECRWADILIAQEELLVKDCASPYVFDKWDGWRYGGYALYLEGEQVRVHNVQNLRGDRPWVVRR